MAGSRFLDRVDAGRQLARALLHHRGTEALVLGLPRGGVPVAAEIARGLGAPLDVVVVRKLGVPGQPELAMGAVGEGGVLVVEERVVHSAQVAPEDLELAGRRQRAEVETRLRLFREGRPRIPLTGRIAVVVDDGIATGSTARAACAVVRALGAIRIVLAVPVCAPGSVRAVASVVDELVCLESPRNFRAVGQFYADFRPTEDDEVIGLLAAQTAE